MLRSCFHCESHFDTVNSSLIATIKNPIQYCSIDCEVAEESSLAADVNFSKSIGLVSEDGIAVIASAPNRQGDLNKFIDSLRIKEK